MSCVKAIESYTGKNGQGRLNCAQAIIHAFSGHFSIPAETVSVFASYGRGGAPDGKCGSLYAVEYILEKNFPEKAKECLDSFKSKAGSTACGEIRALRKLSCVGCVEMAAKTMESIVK